MAYDSMPSQTDAILLCGATAKKALETVWKQTLTFQLKQVKIEIAL